MLPLFVLTPLLVLIVLNVPSRPAWGRAAPVLALLLAGLQVLAVLAAPARFWTDPGLLNGFFSFELAIDAVSRLLLLTIGLVVFVAMLVSQRTLSDERQQTNFVNVLLVALIGMNGTVMVADLFTLYLFIEITAVASYVLISVQRGKDALEGAFKYIILSAVASIMMLTAIALLLILTGSTGFAAVREALSVSPGAPFAKMAVGVFVCGLFIKGGLVPFHGWLPAAYATAPAAVSVLLAGIVTKVSGIYALIRVVLNVFGPNPALDQVLLLVGAASVLIGALGAWAQTDFKRVLAYSSISQVGYIVLGLGCMSQTARIGPLGISVGQLGLIGALFHLFNHAVFKSLLFVNAAAIESSTGTTDMRRLGGLSLRMPVTGVTSVIAALSTAGVPPLAGFWSKLMIIMALWLGHYYGYAVLAVGTSVLTLAYLLLIQRRVFFGQLAPGLENTVEAGPGIAIAAVILATITVGVGVIPPFAFDALVQTVSNIL